MKRPLGNLCLTAILIAILANFAGAFEVETFIENFEYGNEQMVLVGQIDSLSIVRGQFEFHLGKGELTLFDFGGGIPCAMVFKGPVHFIYSPPDEIERYQLNKFTGKDTLDSKFDDITFFYTVELNNLPDTTKFIRQPIPKKAWEQFEQTAKDALYFSGFYLPNFLVGSLMTGNIGSFLYADIQMDNFNHLAFYENPELDDKYKIVKMLRRAGLKTIDVYGGFSEDNVLPIFKGLMPIDVTHYEINSKIDVGGKMTSQCRIHYSPLKDGRQHLRFEWYYKNEPLAALDSKGDTLQIIHKKEEYGLGIILNKPTVIGQDDFIDIVFKCDVLRNFWGVFYIDGQTYWYPGNPFWDRATYDLKYDCVIDYEVVSCGVLVDSTFNNDRCITHWKVETPVNYISFNLGFFESKLFSEEGIPPVKVFIAKNMRHDKMAEYLMLVYGELSSADMIGQIGFDVTNSLTFFSYLLGPCPFNTINVTEIPFYSGQSSPGLIHLSWWTFQSGSSGGGHHMFRAHEVSHQWLGHIIDYASYRDTWIIEGLAEYCAYAYFEKVAVDRHLIKLTLEDWQRQIILGGDVQVYSTNIENAGIENTMTVISEGHIAGPLVLGPRLNSSKSYDYNTLVYAKGAYIFHMLRYLFHDYKTDSDEDFKAFLRDVLEQYKDRPITTEDLKSALEEHLQTDMTWFFNQWVYGIDIPTYTFSYATEKTPDGQFQVTCHVKQENVPADFKMVVPLTVVFEGDQFAHLKYWVDQPETDIQLPPLPLEPKKIDFNTYDAVLCKVNYK